MNDTRKELEAKEVVRGAATGVKKCGSPWRPLLHATAHLAVALTTYPIVTFFTSFSFSFQYSQHVRPGAHEQNNNVGPVLFV